MADTALHLTKHVMLPQPASARARPQQIAWDFDSNFDHAFDQADHAG